MINFLQNFQPKISGPVLLGLGVPLGSRLARRLLVPVHDHNQPVAAARLLVPLSILLVVATDARPVVAGLAQCRQPINTSFYKRKGYYKPGRVDGQRLL